MEKWVKALETYQGERAHCTLIDERGNLCAMGIGLKTAGILRGSKPWNMLPTWSAFRRWIGLSGESFTGSHVPLKPDLTGTTTVIRANDTAKQDAWTIAQRLRETYLKDQGDG